MDDFLTNLALATPVFFVTVAIGLFAMLKFERFWMKR